MTFKFNSAHFQVCIVQTQKKNLVAQIFDCFVRPLQAQQTLQQLFLFVLSQHLITPLSNLINPGSNKRTTA